MSQPAPVQQQQQPQQQGQRVPLSKEQNPIAIAVATAIRHNALLKQRQGILATNKTKTDFFRFKRFVRAVQSAEFKKKQERSPKTIPVVPDDINAINQVFILLIQNQLIIPVEKIKTNDAKKQGFAIDQKTPAIKPAEKAVLQADCYYAWNFNPPNPLMPLYSILAVIAIFTVILFPLWPLWMRKGVWYLSTSLLVFVATFFTIAIVRLIIYLITLATMSRQFWLFPNLFADCGVLESFKPLYGWEDPAKPKKGKKSKKNLETQPVKTETETTTAATTPVNKTTTTSTKPADTAAKKRIPTVEDVEE